MIVVVFVDIVFVVVVITIVVVVVIVFDAIAVVVCNADIQHLQSKVLPPPPHNVRADRAVFLLMLPLASFFSFFFLYLLLNQMLTSIPVLQLFSFHFTFYWSWIGNQIQH